MAKQFETPIEPFERRGSSLPWLVLSIVVLTCLAALLVMAAAGKNWPFASVALLAFGTAVVFLGFSIWTARRTAALKDQKRLDWTSAQPEVQRQNLSVEVLELSKILEVESTQIADLQTAYIVAEDLSLRQIQNDESVLVMRHVTIGKTPFNAVFVKGDILNCIDVSFLVVPDLRQEKLDAMFRKIASVKRTFEQTGIRMKARLMIVLVTQLTADDDERLRNDIKNRFREMPTGITAVINILDFESLQRIYVTE